MSKTDFRDMPGLRRRDIKPCAKCGKGVMHNPTTIAAYTVTIQQHVVDLHAVQQTAGLELMLGSPALAMAMGPDPHLFKSMPEVRHFLCQDCFMFADAAELWELRAKDETE